MSRGEYFLTLLDDHRAAVREFAERAGAVVVGSWLTRRAEGKWTPAQETRHLIMAFEALTRDLLEGKPMRLRGSVWQRLIWRLIGMTSMLWLRRIPTAVSAPREVRPEAESAPQSVLLPLFRTRAEEFEAALLRTFREAPRRTMTHPMFGSVALHHAVRLSSVHTRHHTNFLPAVAR
jgi:hypothetical protein